MKSKRCFERLLLGNTSDVAGLVMTFTVCELENGDLEIVDLLIDSMVDPSIVFCMFTRGYWYFRCLFLVEKYDPGVPIEFIEGPQASHNLGMKRWKFGTCWPEIGHFKLMKSS